MTGLFSKIRIYGVRNSFYRSLHRLVSLTAQIHPYYLFRRYLFGYAIANINGVRMYLDLVADEGLSKELLVFGKREPLTVDHLLDCNLIPAGGITLDVGANIGYYALLESKMVGTNGSVYAVEPISKNFTILNKNIRLNELTNIRSYRLAMGDTEKKDAPIYIRSKGNLSSFTDSSEINANIVGIERVDVTTVDAFCASVIGRAPDFVRMDVEGYEFAIFEGMQDVMRAGASLLVEFHPTILTTEQKEKMCTMLETHYSRAFITINPKGTVGPILRVLNKRIGADSKRGGAMVDGNIASLRELLFSSKRVFNAFISK